MVEMGLIYDKLSSDHPNHWTFCTKLTSYLLLFASQTALLPSNYMYLGPIIALESPKGNKVWRMPFW